MSNGKLMVSGALAGTAWMIGEDLAFTAHHCLPLGATEAEMRFGEGRWTVRVLDRDVDLDVALLLITAPTVGLPPALPLSERPDAHMESRWRAIGFPMVLVDNPQEILALDGHVSHYPPVLPSTHSPHTRMQLTCDQAVPTGNSTLLDDNGDPLPLFRGVSGAPVQVASCGNRVVGLISHTNQQLTERTLYATPVDLIHRHFNLAARGIVLHPWERSATLAAYGTAANQRVVRSSLLLERTTTVWMGEGMPLRMTCEFQPAQHEALATAFLRLALHAPGTVEMRVEQPQAWQAKAKNLGDRWLPLLNSSVVERIARIRWMPVTEAQSLPTSLSTADELEAASAAEAIHRACDDWILTQLNEQVINLLETARTRPTLHYNLPDDLREPMREIWDVWHAQLSRSPAQLQHFLILILTQKGGTPTARAVIGAGPLTLKHCLLKGVVFALAANACLAPGYELAGAGPGNLACTQNGAAHLCGIERIDDNDINRMGRFPEWSTPRVFLHYLTQTPGLIRAMMTRQDQNPSAVGASMNTSFPNALLLGANWEFVEAIETGSAALRMYLERCIEEHAVTQDAYQNASLRLS